MANDDCHLIEHFVSQEEVFKGRFLHIVRDTVRLPDGGSATREYVLHPGAVAVVPILDDGRIVLTINGALILLLGILPGGLMTLCAQAIVRMLAS